MPKLPSETIEKARHMDLLTYLKNYEPYELVDKKNGTFSTREHNSLKISNGKWYWFSRNVGGVSALDYLIKVRGVPFRKAVEIIIGQEQIKAPSFIAKNSQKTDKKLLLPERNLTDIRAKSYLKGRGIDEELIDCCIKKGYIYESAPYHNCVFVGFDSAGIPRYASYRSTNGSTIKGEASGSDKRFSFRIMHDSHVIHLFESAIDLLSFITIVRMDTGKWIKESMISLGGVYMPSARIEYAKMPVALNNALDNNKNVSKIVLHLDKDSTGRAATRAMSVLLGSKYLISDEPPKFGKDVNDELMTRLGMLV